MSKKRGADGKTSVDDTVMFGPIFVIVILVYVMSALDRTFTSRRRQRSILQLEARKKWLAGHDTRNAWQRFFDWQIKPRK